ncbi:MAG: Fic family protein [Alphaproteobacteria bacterium]|nr:Fic family protein [Alphaproteobacteria bacterium]
MRSIAGTDYVVSEDMVRQLEQLALRVERMRQAGRLSPDALRRLRKYFRIKNIYNSNAIEGNILDIGETRMVVEQGLTLTGRPLKDQAEAKNLSEAIDYLEELAADPIRPISEADIRQLHFLVLKNVKDADAGVYRAVQVEIGGSKYMPPGPESVPAQMELFCTWLARRSVKETKTDIPSAILDAAAAHTWFVTIHPFVDGNGRVARLILNLLLMRNGCPIAIVTKADRGRYYDALELSQESDLTAFLALIIECMDESLEEYEHAVREQVEHQEWASSIVEKLDKPQRSRAENEYEVWRNAMELLKSVFQQTSGLLAAGSTTTQVWFKDFGKLEFEKYYALRYRKSAKQTWFFRIDIRSGEKTARYLFFFGSPSGRFPKDSDVTLHVAREEPPGSFKYNRLDELSAPNVPNLVEIGYDAKQESFVSRTKAGKLSQTKIEILCRHFFEEVTNRHFSS